MQEHVRLSMSQPCPQDWGSMTPDAQGRFCAACHKTVVDFSTMSNEEFIAWFQKADTIPCGRYTEDQLSLKIPVGAGLALRQKQQPEEPVIKHPIPYGQAFFFFPNLGKKPGKTAATPSASAFPFPAVASGKVVDAGGNPLAGVWIRLAASGKKTKTDEQGRFYLPLPHRDQVLSCQAGKRTINGIRINDLSRPLLIVVP